MARFAFNRNATEEDWCALPRAFKAGEVVGRYDGYDYGCSADDLRLGGVETVACTLDISGEATPFFTVPIAWLTNA